MSEHPQYPQKKSFTSTVTFRKGLTAFGVVASLIVFYFILLRLGEIGTALGNICEVLTPVFIGIALAYLLNPAMKWFQRILERPLQQKKMPARRAKSLAKGLSIAISMTLALAIIIIICILVLPSLFSSVVELVKNLPDQLKTAAAWATEKINTGKTSFGTTVEDLINRAIAGIQTWLSDNLLTAAQNAFSYLTSSIIGIVTMLINIFIGFVVAIYALKDKEIFLGQAKKINYALFGEKHGNTVVEVFRHANRIFGGFITGRLVDSAIVGVITFIAMLFFNTPYTLLIAVVIGVTNIIPFFGPFIGAIPSAFLVLLDDPMKGLYFIIFIIVLQQLDGNIICPKIVGSATGVSEFWVTAALLLGGYFFGFIGMIIAVPLFSVIYYLFKRFINGRLRRRCLPEDTALYRKAWYLDEDTGRILTEEDLPKPENPAGTI